MRNPILRRRDQRGLSIVELLVGVALGLFLVAGAATLFVSHLANSRRLVLEARVNQELRATTDLIARDLRRGGYWGNAIAGTVITSPATIVTPNPYVAVTDGSEIIEFTYSRDAVEDGVASATERSGFKRNGTVVQAKINNGWQDLTDPNTIAVSELTIVPTETPVDARDSCAVACCSAGDVAAGIPATCTVANIAAGATCPRVGVRQYQLTLTASAATDARVTRTLTTSVRVRNDEQSGVCPA